ncbi:sulfur carrier protein ThiS [compost metagenome]|jgi:sulfur carrier protein
MTDMDILLNGRPLALADSATLADAVSAAQIAPPFAAAVNGQFVPRGAHANTLLAAGDRIDLVQPVTGG